MIILNLISWMVFHDYIKSHLKSVLDWKSVLLLLLFTFFLLFCFYIAIPMENNPQSLFKRIK